MATLWLYRCTKCLVEWSLLSKRYQLGPGEWGSVTHTCFACQTFLSIARSFDSNSWRVWTRGCHSELEKNPILLELVNEIERRLTAQRPFTPLVIHFDSIACPTCRELMSTEPFGRRSMKCPACKEYAGVNPEPGVIHTI